MSSHPSAIQAVRNSTKKYSAPGVMFPTFECRSCKRFKRTSGRKAHPAGGFKCGDCCAND